jgi:hypothetical protein
MSPDGKLDRRLDANLHPVTRVYSDADGIVWYERRGADPLPISAGSPRLSRIEALRRAEATDAANRRQMSRKDGHEAIVLDLRPISESGFGLSYREYREQTIAAVLESRRRETGLAEAAARRYGGRLL